jgi:hypothetical protein
MEGLHVYRSWQQMSEILENDLGLPSAPECPDEEANAFVRAFRPSNPLPP